CSAPYSFRSSDRRTVGVESYWWGGPAMLTRCRLAGSRPFRAVDAGPSRERPGASGRAGPVRRTGMPWSEAGSSSVLAPACTVAVPAGDRVASELERSDRPGSVPKARSVATTHTAIVAAPPRAVFRLIAEATRWPFLFPPVVHVDRLDGGPAEDRLRLWTVSNGAVRSWVSRRRLDQDGLRIRFRHES